MCRAAAITVGPVVKVIQQILCSRRLWGCTAYKCTCSCEEFWEKRHLIPRRSSNFVKSVRSHEPLVGPWIHPDGCYPALFPFSSSGLQKWREEGKRMCGTRAVCFSNMSVTAVGSEWRRKEAGELCCAQRKSACV